MKSCRRTRVLLKRSFDQCLTLDEGFRLEEHVASCPPCKAEFDRHDLLVDALMNLPAPPVGQLDVEASVRAVGAAIDATDMETNPGGARSFVRRLAWILAAAAVLAVLFLLAEREHELDPPPQTAARAKPSRPVPPLLTTGETNFDPAILAVKRKEVRAQLSAALPIGGDLAAFGRRFEIATLHLGEAGWPIARIVGGLAEDTDPSVRRGALRYLGLCGDRASLAVLRRALASKARKGEALEALFDAAVLAPDPSEILGDLEHAVWDEDLRSAALARAARLEPDRAAGWVERAVASENSRMARGDVLRELFSFLGRGGEAGSAALLRLARRTWPEGSSPLDSFEEGEAAARALAAAVDDPAFADHDAVLLEALETVRPPEALDYVAARCDARRGDTRALSILALFEGTEAVVALLAVRSRCDDELFLTTIDQMLAVDDERFVALARRCSVEGDRSLARNLLVALIESEHERAATAVLELCRGEVLDSADRERSLLALAELRSDDALPVLIELFASLRRADSSLAAADLLAIHALGGSDEALAGLEFVSRSRLARIRSLLASSDALRSSAITLFKLARELEPVLLNKPEDFRRQTP